MSARVYVEPLKLISLYVICEMRRGSKGSDGVASGELATMVWVCFSRESRCSVGVRRSMMVRIL